MNTSYARFSGSALQYAPDSVRADMRTSSAAEYRAAGWLPVRRETLEARSGYEIVADAPVERGGEIVFGAHYEPVAPAPILVSKAKVEAAIDRMGKTALFVAWLNSRAAYIGAWLRGGDAIAYDPADNSSDLASLVAALGIPAEAVEALVAEVLA